MYVRVHIVFFLHLLYVVIDEMVISSMKYEVINSVISSFESRMVLTVRQLTAGDVGGYRCVAKNSLGEVDSIIRLYEIPGPTIRNTSPATKKDEYKYSTPIEGPDNQFGSAERPDDEDESITDALEDSEKASSTHDNATYKNKSLIYVSDKQNLSNKIRKIINKLEIEEEKLEMSKGYDLHSMRASVYTLVTGAVIFHVLKSVCT